MLGSSHQPSIPPHGVSGDQAEGLSLVDYTALVPTTPPLPSPPAAADAVRAHHAHRDATNMSATATAPPAAAGGSTASAAAGAVADHSSAGQNGRPSEIAAAPPAARPAVPAVPQPYIAPSLTGPMPDPVAQPMDLLETVLMRIAALDKECFFQNPVDETVAPRYHEIIAHPMSFATMRAKLRAGSYMTWRVIRDDFELIIANARQYNASKTLVFHAASALGRNAQKLLALAELDARKALIQLFPDTAHLVVGTADGGFAGFALAPAGDHEPLSEDAAASPSLPGSPQHEAAAALSMPPPPPPLPSETPWAMAASTAAVTASGAQDFLSEDELGQPFGSEAAAAAGPAVPHRPPQALDSVLRQMRISATWQPWDVSVQAAGHTGDDLLGGSLGEAAADDGADQPSSSGLRGELASARRPAEWQCRWLEQRMLSLKAQQRHLELQLLRDSQRDSQDAAAGARHGTEHEPPDMHHPGRDNSRMAEASACAAHDGDRHQHSEEPHSSQAYRAAVMAQQDAAAGPASLPWLPPAWAGAHAAAATSDRPGSSSAGGAAGAGGGTHEEQLLLPAAAFCALELLEQQLSQLESSLHVGFDSVINAANARRDAASIARSLSSSLALPSSADAFATAAAAAASPFASRQQPYLRRTSSTGGRGGGFGGSGGGSAAVAAGGAGPGGSSAFGPSLTVNTRMDSLPGQGKRRRSDAESLDGLTWPTSAKASLDRGQMADILIPPVRELSQPECEARQVALTHWAARYLAQGKRAFEVIPPEIAAVLPSNDEEGSSSEDTGDEAYAARHAPHEAEEHKRYVVVASEGQRKRNIHHGNGKTGLKTPRSQRADGESGFQFSPTGDGKQDKPHMASGSGVATPASAEGAAAAATAAGAGGVTSPSATAALAVRPVAEGPAPPPATPWEPVVPDVMQKQQPQQQQQPPDAGQAASPKVETPSSRGAAAESNASGGASGAGNAATSGVDSGVGGPVGGGGGGDVGATGEPASADLLIATEGRVSPALPAASLPSPAAAAAAVAATAAAPLDSAAPIASVPNPSCLPILPRLPPVVPLPPAQLRAVWPQVQQAMAVRAGVLLPPGVPQMPGGPLVADMTQQQAAATLQVAAAAIGLPPFFLQQLQRPNFAQALLFPPNQLYTSLPMGGSIGSRPPHNLLANLPQHLFLGSASGGGPPLQKVLSSESIARPAVVDGAGDAAVAGFPSASAPHAVAHVLPVSAANFAGVKHGALSSLPAASVAAASAAAASSFSDAAGVSSGGATAASGQNAASEEAHDEMSDDDQPSDEEPSFDMTDGSDSVTEGQSRVRRRGGGRGARGRGRKAGLGEGSLEGQAAGSGTRGRGRGRGEVNGRGSRRGGRGRRGVAGRSG